MTYTLRCTLCGLTVTLPNPPPPEPACIQCLGEMVPYTDRAREKQCSREDDDRSLAFGEKSREDLCRENGHFTFPNVRVSLRGSKPLK